MNNSVAENAVLYSTLAIGDNNVIGNNVRIHENVKIGNNNVIHDDVIIYPGTVIGNNNIIFNGNIIGEIPVQSNGTFQDRDFNETKHVIIGNNNFLHVKNIIFAGTERNTYIGDNNKILCDCHVNHDCYIGNNVTLYPRVTLAGFVKCLDHCNIGGSSFIHQYKTIGQYCMIGANNFVGKNVFPYFVYIDNKITRLNTIKIPLYAKDNESAILEIARNYYMNADLNPEHLQKEIIDDISLFLIKIKT